jgi:hypothetical protein
VARPDIAERADHRVLAPRHPPLDVGKHRLHGVALQAVLAAAQVAGDDRERHRLGEARQIGLGAKAERAQHRHVALVVHQLRRHRRQPAAMEQVEEEGLQNVLAVVAEHKRRAPLLPRDAIEMAAPEPRAQRAIGAVFRNLVGDDRIGVLMLDAVGNPVRLQEIRQDVLGKVRLALVEVARDELDGQQAAPFQVEQQREQPVGILAARQRHQPALTRPHHREILERLARVAQQPLAQLVELDRGRRIPEHRVAGRALALLRRLDRGGRRHDSAGRRAAPASIEK